jgi:hypothetical protein
MGVQEILRKYVVDLEPSVRLVLVEVILAEQQYADMKSTRALKERIRDAIDSEVRRVENDR